jgi:hypothetical protein
MARRARRSVVVVSTPADRHAQRVMAALRRRGAPAHLVSTARFPGRLALGLQLPPSGAGWRGALRAGRGAPLDAAAVSAVWWRRPRGYTLPRSLDRATWGGAYCACHAAITAFWRSLDARWVNPPDAEMLAEHKPTQLALASRLGLTVPRTCVTNDPAVAADFIRERPPGETIHKNVVTMAALWRTTRVARADDRALLASIRRLPLIFQERVQAEADVRVTLVGSAVFAAEIDFPRGRPALDWRVAFHRARLRPVRLPRPVEAKLRRLVRQLGLAFATLDLRRRADGEHVFLEVNPSGEWLFIEDGAGHPISEALADLLAGAR